MSDFNLFDSIKKGLDESIEYEKGNSSKARVSRVKFEDVPQYKAQEVKLIREKSKLTQSAFAEFMGVSKKTVEAWESGINIPQGSSQRLLDIINKDNSIIQEYVSQYET